VSDGTDDLVKRLAAGVNGHFNRFPSGHYHDANDKLMEVHGNVIGVTDDLLVEVLCTPAPHRPDGWNQTADRAFIPLGSYLKGGYK